MAKINKNTVQTNNAQSLARDEEGLSTVEYVIILFLIAIIQASPRGRSSDPR